MRIICKPNKDLCTTVPNGSLTFVTGNLSRLNGTSDLHLRGHGLNYGTEERQPSVVVRNAAVAPKISRRLSYYLHRERWKVIRKHLKGHTCFKRLNNRFASEAGVIYFVLLYVKKCLVIYRKKTKGTRTNTLTDGFKDSVSVRRI